MNKRVTIACCQLPDVRQDVEQSLRYIINYAEKAEAQGAALVCFPECYLQGYVFNGSTRALAFDLSSTSFQAILDRLAEIRPELIIGLIETENNMIYNTAVVVKEGKVLGRYRKVKLVAGEQEFFEPGYEFPVFETDGLRYGINICYDLNFPDCVEAVAKQKIDLLVCPCNNMLNCETAEKWKHKHNEIRAKRSLEAGIWLLSSDVTGEREGHIAYGPTALINREGVVVDQVPLMEEGFLVHEIDTHVRNLKKQLKE